jgi:hypothetical protein
MIVWYCRASIRGSAGFSIPLPMLTNQSKGIPPWFRPQNKFAGIEVRACTDAASRSGWLTLLFCVAWASSIIVTSCAPLPCPGGYADADWCRHSGSIGSDGSGG